MLLKKKFGFTLAELLIALAVLGIVATFTIPKIIISQQNNKYNAIAKEAAAAVSGAFQQYKATGADLSVMNASALNSYINYLKLDTSTVIDNVSPGTSNNFSSADPCFELANGAILHHYGDNFCNAAKTAIPFDVDPDGVYGGTTNGPDKSVRFFLYSNGHITTEGTLDAGTQWAGNGSSTCGYTRSAIPASDPSWFSW
jgi:prepilin-type N-terminal cleavage/methylation domain-containing protein